MNTSLESLQDTHTQKTAVYFAMRKSLTTATDSERRALEKASGKLFTELVELGARAYPTVHYSQL